LKKPFLITHRLKLAPPWPGESGERLRMSAMKNGMRLKSFCAKQPGDAVEKHGYSFNRLAAFDFVNSLDHGFIPELGLGSDLSLP
jgi:hypothetical protein